MDINRLVNIVLSDIGLDNLKETENLETAISSKEDINTKTSAIKSCLQRIAINDLMIMKFKSYVVPADNNASKQKENGNV